MEVKLVPPIFDIATRCYDGMIIHSNHVFLSKHGRNDNYDTSNMCTTIDVKMITIITAGTVEHTMQCRKLSGDDRLDEDHLDHMCLIS